MPQAVREDREEQQRRGDSGQQQPRETAREGAVAHVEEHDRVDHEYHHRTDVDEDLEHRNHVHAEERIDASERKHGRGERQRDAHRMPQHEHQDGGGERGAGEKPEEQSLDHDAPRVVSAPPFGG